MSHPPIILQTTEQTQDPVVTKILSCTVAVRDRLTRNQRQKSSATFGRATLISPTFPGPTLDLFNRADGVLSAPWTTPAFSFGNLNVNTNQVAAPVTSGAAMWSQAQFADCAAQVDVPVLPAAGNGNAVWVRMDGSSATPSGYRLRVTPSTSAWSIRRHDASGSGTEILALTQAFNAGDSFALQAIGSRLIAWYKPAGGTVWQAIGSVVDATYTKGFIGMSAGDTTTRLDNFGGGTPVDPTNYEWIGPYPPTVVNDTTPTLRQQTITTCLTRTRPRPTVAAVAPPATLEPASVQDRERRIRVALVQTRPRPTTAYVSPPSTLEPYSVALQLRTIRVDVVRIRPRRTTRFLNPPTVLQTFSGPRTPLVRIRPGPPTAYISPPATLEPAAVAQAERTIRVSLTRIRPRPTRRFLRPPAVLQTFSGPVVHLVRTRPARTHSALRPPTTTATVVTTPLLAPISVHLTRGPQPQRAPKSFLSRQPIIPVEVIQLTILVADVPRLRIASNVQRAPHSKLRPPVPTPPVVTTIRVQLVRTRPRPTTASLSPPTVLRTFAGPRTPLVRTRPRPTTAYVSPPATLEPRSVFIAERTIRVKLARIRPVRTHPRLAPPTVLQTFAGPSTHLVRTRPRPTVRVLRAPTVLQTFGGPAVHLVRARPRPTLAYVAPPATLEPASVQQAERTILRKLVRIRPPHTVAELRPPATLESEFTFIRERTITVALVRTRPRPTRRFLSPPTAFQTFAGPVTHLVRIRPPATRSRLAPPTALRTFTGPVVHLVRIRPVRTLAKIIPPPVVAAPFIPQPIRTWLTAVAERLTLLRRRPRPVLSPPNPGKTVPGVACLIDTPAVVACLLDAMAAAACLTDEDAAVGCLEDESAATGCLVDQSAMHATLTDQEE